MVGIWTSDVDWGIIEVSADEDSVFLFSVMGTPASCKSLVVSEIFGDDVTSTTDSLLTIFSHCSTSLVAKIRTAGNVRKRKVFIKMHQSVFYNLKYDLNT